MKIGIIGGTGGMGEGFALRWGLRHDIIIGSRESSKAKNVAENYTKIANEEYGKRMVGSIVGEDNSTLAKYCDLILLSIPYESIKDTCDMINKDVRSDCIIVSPIVPMTRTVAGFVYIPFEDRKKTAAEAVAEFLSPRSRVLTAFHTISEIKLKNINQSLDADTFVCGDDLNMVAVLNNLISELNGLRSIYLGPLSIAYQAEVLTPILLNAAKRNKIKNPGLKVV
ncbi:MAG TPA: NADPH-dependent F420 reductase [Nitrososphaeraceae archaeon]|jgi:NADPH-dependent F420 reductase|nr:NADPH-dependent F420 reductase [Nitrososphaeraceae archaeon]